MGLFNELIETYYTFSLQIECNGQTVIGATIGTVATAEGIARAKDHIQRVMEGYTPVVVPKTPVKAPAAVGHAPAAQQGQPVGAIPKPAARPATPKEPEGVMGLVHMHCAECGSDITTLLKEPKKAFHCRCGHDIDLTVPLAKFWYTCPYCEKRRCGKTNLEDAFIAVQCSCGGLVDLEWVPKEREYRN